MTPAEAKHIEVVRRYFDGCNSGDLEVLLSTLAPDVVHYFLPSSRHSVRGAETLAKYFQKSQNVLNQVWSIDHIIAQGDEVVSEFSSIWTPRKTQKRIITRGSEWYVMRGARIAEVRAYFISDDSGNTELTGFPYAERGYPTLPA